MLLRLPSDSVVNFVSKGTDWLLLRDAFNLRSGIALSRVTAVHVITYNHLLRFEEESVRNAQDQ